MTFPSRLRRQNLKTSFARHLRVEMTEPERRVWGALRAGNVAGLRFRRQQPIGPYVVDFFCATAKLVIELDGDQHGADHALLCDKARTQQLEAHGYHVLRFPNRDAYAPGVIVEAVVHYLEEHDIPLPEALRASTLPQGEGRKTPSRGG